MAIDMVKAIKKVNREKKINLNMRIGLHTGTLIAGITGTNIVRYDIYGGDNDIANKMESGGAAGKINVSEDTMRLLEETTPGRFAFAFNKVITHEPTNRSIPSFFVSPTNADELVS
jgi:class 3 adenylate cyclase